VYPEYAEQRHLIAPFDISPIEPIYVGQDLNSGFSKGIAFIIRGNRLFAVKEYSFAAIGNAPRMLRNDFPMNEIYWYPDATAKEIMMGYQKEVQSMGIKLRMGTVNPSITERIFSVNKLFKMDRIAVFNTLKQYPMALKTRQFDKKGDPEKGQGISAPDHICDGAEYVIWRIISSNAAFRDLYEVILHGKANQEEEAAA